MESRRQRVRSVRNGSEANDGWRTYHLPRPAEAHQLPIFTFIICLPREVGLTQRHRLIRDGDGIQDGLWERRANGVEPFAVGRVQPFLKVCCVLLELVLEVALEEVPLMSLILVQDLEQPLAGEDLLD